MLNVLKTPNTLLDIESLKFNVDQRTDAKRDIDIEPSAKLQTYKDYFVRYPKKSATINVTILISQWFYQIKEDKLTHVVLF